MRGVWTPWLPRKCSLITDNQVSLYFDHQYPTMQWLQCTGGRVLDRGEIGANIICYTDGIIQQNSYIFFSMTQHEKSVLVIQKTISIMLKMLIPVKRPRMPPNYLKSKKSINSCQFLPKADTLSNKLSLLEDTVTGMSLVASLNFISALYWIVFTQMMLGWSDTFWVKNLNFSRIHYF